jgi:hypothetical protein
MTETRRAGHPKKAFYGRIKVLAVVLSIVAFVGSLAGIAVANPATGNRSAPSGQPPVAVQALNLRMQSSAGNLVLPARPQMPRVRPMTRTRGS